MKKFEDLMPPVDRIRKLTLPALSQRRMAGTSFEILNLAETVLDSLCKRGKKFDLFTEYFLTVSAQSLNAWLGVPNAYRGEHERLYSRLSPDLGKGEDSNPEDALEQLLDSFVRIASNDSIAPGLIDDLRRKQVSPTETGTICCLMVMAGLEPTANASALACLALGISDMSKVFSFSDLNVDELLRFDGPVFPGAFRWATEDTNIGGTAVFSGEMILLSLAAANRDESVFPSAKDLVPSRPNASQHLAFGAGLNRCVGAPLAKIIIQSSITVIEDFEFRKIETKWRDFALRGFVSIPAVPA
ncbi:cytochrome P450 [Glutamicibacter sp. NPDC087344]|uniref:cytochrome P450 n=1 Tax=Glutamicibacter sp. NPDC087344 TaxID=3363994 RepID=UPI003823122E